MTDLKKMAQVIHSGVMEKLGLSYKEMKIAQVLCVAEEAGEFVGAYRRYEGMARRDGSWQDVQAELADVVISAYTAAHAIGFDLDEAIEEKLGKVMTRGWKNPTPA